MTSYMIVCYVQMKQFCKNLFQIGTGKTYAKSRVPRFHCRMNFNEYLCRRKHPCGVSKRARDPLVY